MEKSKVQQVLDSQPDQFDVDAFVERLYLLEKIEIAEAQIARGEVVAHDEAMQRLAVH